MQLRKAIGGGESIGNRMEKLGMEWRRQSKIEWEEGVMGYIAPS